MASKNEKLRSSMIEIGLKSKRAKERSEKKKKEKTPAQWLRKEWNAMMRAFHPGVKTEWSGADYSLAKKLVKELGDKQAKRIVEHFIETWDRRKASRTGVPGMRLCWVMRDQLLAEIEGKVKIRETREMKIRSGEYAGTGDDSANAGWGDRDDDPYEGIGNGW